MTSDAHSYLIDDDQSGAAWTTLAFHPHLIIPVSTTRPKEDNP